MKSPVATSRGIVVGVLLAALALSHVRAEDIEIYVGASNGTAVNPNVLFILDNSGSMTSNSLNAPTPYNSSTNYAGSYDPAYYYRALSGSLPNAAVTDDKIAIANLQCQTGVTAIGLTGIYTDKFLAWHVDTGDAALSNWSGLLPFSAGAEDVECFTDAGVHGNGGGDLYPNDGAGGPWGSAASTIDWNSRGEYHTLYSANFLNYKESPVLVNTTRYNTMVQVVDEMLRRISQVNAGLMWFTYSSGGFVDKEVLNLQTYSNRLDLLSVVNTPQSNTWTPLSETLYEAYLYYTGGEIDWGENSGALGDTGSAESVDASRVSGDLELYESPITEECQKNYVVLLTDGQPTRDSSSNDEIQDLPDFADVTGSSSCDKNGFGSDGKCLEELSFYMNKPPGDDLMSGFAGDQTVQTYTIAFDLNDNTAQNLLRQTAEGASAGDPGGGGTYYEANSADTLSSAFVSLLTEISSINSTFTSPSVSVNAFNRRVNREYLYYTMFATGKEPAWEGNLKKYRIDFDSDGHSYITDSTSTNPDVVNSQTGDFVNSARSYWSDSADGGIVLNGGIRDRLTDSLLSSRNVWTYTGTSTNLNHSSNLVHESNASVSKALLNIPAATDAYRTEVLKWARGVDVNDVDTDSSTSDSRKSVADPLHSQPVVTTYGGTSANPEQVIFFSTNNGYVHAIDEDSGDEIFSFIPQELLGGLPQLYDNLPTTSRPYGLDGSVNLWVEDVDEDGIIEPIDGDHVYLYVGMRRGGRNYYALDVTHIRDTSPLATLMWKIVDGDLVAGSAGTSASGAYSEMGQSWSKPVVRKIKVSGIEKTVLVVGGGYDTNQDNNATPDGIGRAVYFINAETGAREWWASSDPAADLTRSNMTYSIPSRVAAHDIDGDNLLDRLYVGDMGGQLWRFDVDSAASSSANLVQGGRIADLSDATASGARRFYSAPDVALLAGATSSYLTILLGSGYRAHPLDTSTLDRLYMIKDRDIFSAPSSYDTVREAELYDATSNDIGEQSGSTQQTAINQLNSADGWYIRLASGEKSLSAPLVTGGVAIMSTFEPFSGTNACDPPGGGEGKVYYVNLGDATPVFNFNGSGNETNLIASDRYRTLAAPGIPPETTIVVSVDDDGNASTTVLHGKEKGEDPSSNKPMKSFWFEQLE